MRYPRLSGLMTAAFVVAIAGTGCSSSPAAAGASTSATSNSSAPNVSRATGPATQSTPQTAEAPIQLGHAGLNGLIAEYDTRCKKETVESLECEAMRSLLVAEVTTGLMRIEKSGDQRGTEEALDGLAQLDEPEILVAAMRVLGHFPETPNLAQKVLPLLLDSPYIRVQSMAANVLIAHPDEGFQSLGRMWREGHQELPSSSVYDEYPALPDHYDSMAFPQYAGCEWFSAGDSDRSIGWSTKDDAAAVAKWYGDTLHAQIMDADTWFPMSTNQMIQLVQPDQAKTTRMQQLMERLMRGDQTAQAEFDKLNAEVEASSKLANEAVERSVVKATMPDSTFARDARWIIVAKKGERISKMVMIFPIPQIQRTVIKEIWDLTDYPSAWPKK